ncbi:MAG TPA: hypothetical protein VMM78_08940, partial [Thermomicrobiales bacterium]|nr:hypothetical protein [Thermomicrobiales bacterium]
LSRVQLMQRLYGRRHAAFVRVALLAGYLIHIVREALKWVVGHRRELRRERVAFYARLIRTGLRSTIGRRT